MTNFTIGYDYLFYDSHGVEIPIKSNMGHLILVGGSGSGKSTTALYWLRNNLTKNNEITKFYIMDFKESNEYRGLVSEHYEFEDCIQGITKFYNMFLKIPEGGDGNTHVLVIDEIAGLLNHLSIQGKDSKKKSDEIRRIMSSILMLGRSRKCYLWLILQRYTASIFPNASGAADNFSILVGMGNLTTDSRRLLFANEDSENINKLRFGQGKGIILLNGEPLNALLIPQVNKEVLRQHIINQKCNLGLR